MKERAVDIEEIKERICGIPDPEIPVVTIGELGMVRSIKYNPEGILEVKITPTYSGCPAYHWMAMEIKITLEQSAIYHYQIIEQLSPAWTTEWMGEEAKKKLKDYGISPPKSMAQTDTLVECPQCDSVNTELISEFGSTACKSFYKCKDCLEPFDHFKCH